MRNHPVILHLPNGDTHILSTSGAREFRLCDRAFLQVRAVIENRRLRPALRLDAELSWLRKAVKIEEPDGAFAELQRFIRERLDEIAFNHMKQQRRKQHD